MMILFPFVGVNTIIMSTSKDVNPALATSFLFLVPAAAALYLSAFDVAIACVICFLTSVWNHSQECTNPTAQKVDQITVRLIALGYTLNAILYIGPSNPYVMAMCLIGIMAAITYIYLGKHPELYHKHHYLVHVLSNTGIMLYILSRKSM